MTTDSLKKRYLSKLIANIVGLGIGLITQAIIPRGLGPKAYGDFYFLSTFFNQIVNFLNMGTSPAFYTKLSQRQKDFSLVSFYLSFTSIGFFLLLVFLGCIQVTGTYTMLLPDQALFYIYLAAFWAILGRLVQILNQMADAYGVTVSAELGRIIQKGLGLAIIVALFFSNQLNLTHFFFYHYFVLIFLALTFIWVMELNGHTVRRSWRLSSKKIRAYAKEFYSYSHPLFFVVVVALIVGVLDRWMLQKFGGSVQQGFYGLSYQIGSVCFVFSGAMAPLIAREFSIAFKNNDLSEMARLFRRYIPMLYAIAAYFGCFIAVEANKVTLLMGGDEFQHATLPVGIMALYPIHQTYGQLSGTVFYATGQTRLIRNISIIFLILGLPVTYFLIAPKNMMGLAAGATGLAIKMVAMQFIIVNVQLYFNARLLGLRLLLFIGHQIGTIVILFLFALISDFLVSYFLMFLDTIIIEIIIGGIIYTTLTAALLIIFPPLLGLNRSDIINLKKAVLATFCGQ